MKPFDLEAAKRDERIESLTAAGAEYQRQCFEQSDRIKWLEQFRKQVIETYGEASKNGSLYLDMANMIEKHLLEGLK